MRAGERLEWVIKLWLVDMNPSVSMNGYDMKQLLKRIKAEFKNDTENPFRVKKRNTKTVEAQP
jgi:hypothetical protein